MPNSPIDRSEESNRWWKNAIPPKTWSDKANDRFLEQIEQEANDSASILDDRDREFCRDLAKGSSFTVGELEDAFDCAVRFQLRRLDQ